MDEPPGLVVARPEAEMSLNVHGEPDMPTMSRSEAILVLSNGAMRALSAEERANLLLNWWTLDEGDPEHAELPERTRELMAQSDAPPSPSGSELNPLVLLAIRTRYLGVRNEYLGSRLLSEIGMPATVVGEVEEMTACPCCRYMSIGHRSNHEVCPVCFWEDDGTTAMDSHSGSNHMTLRQAQNTFSSIGAVTADLIKYVLPDGKSRYLHADSNS